MIANAFGVQTCQQFYKVKYIRLSELLDELAVAKYEADRIFVLEIIEARIKRTFMIFCSQFSLEGWHSKLVQAQIADAILHRIVHDLYKIHVVGKVSMGESDGLALS